MAKGRLFFSLALFFTMVCCENKKVSKNELWEYITETDNGLYILEERSGTEVEMYYKPVDLLVAQELAGKDVSIQIIDSMRSNYLKQLYFVVNIGHDGKDLEWYVGNKLPYINLASQMAPYFNLYTDSGKRVDLKGYYFAGLGGVAAKSSFILSFDNVLLKDKINTLTLELSDIGFGVGTFKKLFEVHKIEDAPYLY